MFGWLFFAGVQIENRRNCWCLDWAASVSMKKEKAISISKFKPTKIWNVIQNLKFLPDSLSAVTSISKVKPTKTHSTLCRVQDSNQGHAGTSWVVSWLRNPWWIIVFFLFRKTWSKTKVWGEIHARQEQEGISRQYSPWWRLRHCGSLASKRLWNGKSTSSVSWSILLWWLLCYIVYLSKEQQGISHHLLLAGKLINSAMFALTTTVQGLLHLEFFKNSYFPWPQGKPLGNWAFSSYSFKTPGSWNYNVLGKWQNVCNLKVSQY